MNSRNFDAESSEGRQIHQYLSQLRIRGSNNRIYDAIELFRKKTLVLAHDQLDPDAIISTNSSIVGEYNHIFQNMNEKRSLTDSRRTEDREFHYKVDAWNIALRLVNRHDKRSEISHICRHSIREYDPGKDGQIWSRHPLVPMYQLYSLFRSPAEADIHQESQAFLEDAVTQINRIVMILSRPSIDRFSQLPPYSRTDIDVAYNKFVRPLFYNYSNMDIEAQAGCHTIKTNDDLGLKEYKSITTAEGFRDRFKQQADGLRVMAQKMVEIVPEIGTDSLLESYDLSDNPRIKEIRKKLRLE